MASHQQLPWIVPKSFLNRSTLCATRLKQRFSPTIAEQAFSQSRFPPLEAAITVSGTTARGFG